VDRQKQLRAVQEAAIELTALVPLSSVPAPAPHLLIGTIIDNTRALLLVVPFIVASMEQAEAQSNDQTSPGQYDNTLLSLMQAFTDRSSVVFISLPKLLWLLSANPRAGRWI
jgi:hypothetical protein